MAGQRRQSLTEEVAMPIDLLEQSIKSMRLGVKGKAKPYKGFLSIVIAVPCAMPTQVYV